MSILKCILLFLCFGPIANAQSTNCLWNKDISHLGKRPDCPDAIITAERTDGYKYSTLASCQNACLNTNNCNLIVRFGTKSDGDNWHCRAHACPDLNNINWVIEDRWGNGASTCVSYLLTCPSPTLGPSASPTLDPSASPTTFLPVTVVTASPSNSPSDSPTATPTATPTNSPTATPTNSPTVTSPAPAVTELSTSQPTDAPTVQSSPTTNNQNTKELTRPTLVEIALIATLVVETCLIISILMERKSCKKTDTSAQIDPSKENVILETNDVEMVAN